MAWRAALGRQLREVRVLVAGQGDGTSAGVTKWVIRRIDEMKMLNPGFPILVREHDAIDPSFIIEFDWGEAREVDLTGFTEKQVDDTLKEVVTMALQHEEYQKAREPRVAPWLRRPVDVVDEIGRDTPRIPYVQPRNNIHWSLEEIAAMNKEKDEILEQVTAENEKEAARLARKAMRS